MRRGVLPPAARRWEVETSVHPPWSFCRRSIRRPRHRMGRRVACRGAAAHRRWRVAPLWRRFERHQVLAARSDRQRQRRGTPDRLAVEDRQFRTATGFLLPGDAADDWRGVVHHRWLEPQRGRHRWRYRRNAVDAPLRRGRTRHQGADSRRRRPGRGVLDRRAG